MRLREVLGRRGLLYCGDCKMAALETRADLQRHGDYYLVPLPLSPSNAALLDRAVTSAVEGDQVCELIWDGPRLLGAGYDVSRRVQADGDAAGARTGPSASRWCVPATWPRGMPEPWSRTWSKPRWRPSG